MAKILLKTTIPYTDDDWHIGRFSLLARQLQEDGHDVTARDRVVDEHGNDTDLIPLAECEWRQLWLFAVDVVGALTKTDCDNIRQFRAGGGGAMLTRDHEDMGACLTNLGIVGAAHHFHSVNSEPDEQRRQIDDPYTKEISWPNYHSGANGDVQEISAADPVHPILQRIEERGGIRYLPAHPHEGAVSVPAEAKDFARVIAVGKSTVTGRSFNLAVAFETHEENGERLGRALATSTFHHFCDYNLDPALGCPSFVTERPGNEIKRNPEAKEDVLTYFSNIARWLGT